VDAAVTGAADPSQARAEHRRAPGTAFPGAQGSGREGLRVTSVHRINDHRFLLSLPASKIASGAALSQVLPAIRL